MTNVTATQRILLAEDERSLCGTTTRALELLHYEVTPVEDGLCALQALQEAPGFFDLVMTDATMPEIDGPELIRELRKCGNHVPVLLTSGRSRSEFDGIGLDECGGVAFLEKPWTLSELGRVLRCLLEATAPGLGSETSGQERGGPVRKRHE